eukprot:SAG11_NODE_11025_length_789_cov_0.856522_2_plen_147_part_01
MPCGSCHHRQFIHWASRPELHLLSHTRLTHILLSQTIGQGSVSSWFEEGLFEEVRQRLFSETEISDGWARAAGLASDEIRLHIDRGPDRSVHNDPPKQKVQPTNSVPVLRSQGAAQNLQIQSPVLSPHSGPHCVHKVLETDSGLRKN